MADEPSARVIVPIRALAINVVLTIFLSIVVFVVSAEAFVLPRIQIQERRIGDLSEQVRQLTAAVQQGASQASAAAPASASPTPAQPASATAAK